MRTPRHEGQHRPQLALPIGAFEHHAPPVVRVPEPPERHAEPALRGPVAPVVRALQQIRHLLGRDVLVPPDPHGVPGPLHPVEGLPYGPHGAPFEGELGDLDEGLVPEFEGVEAVPCVDRARLLARAHDGRNPSVSPCLRQPGLDRAGPRLRVADRVAGGQRHPSHHPVRDGRLAGRRPHHALLPAQREVAEGVPLALSLQQRPELLLVVLGERVDGAPGAERGVEHGEDQDRAEDVDDDVDPVRGPDAGEAILRGGDGHQPERAVAPALHEGRTGRVVRLVGDRHQQCGEQGGGQGAADGDDGGEPGLDRSPFA